MFTIYVIEIIHQISCKLRLILGFKLSKLVVVRPHKFVSCERRKMKHVKGITMALGNLFGPALSYIAMNFDYSKFRK